MGQMNRKDGYRIINSTEPAARVEYVWSEGELRPGLESFEAALVIWRNEKDYDPRAFQERTEGLKAPVVTA
jgi:hypothetical protein